MKCTEPAYNTPFEALFSPEQGHVRDGNHECKKCKQCGKWHLREIPPLEETFDEEEEGAS
jgi:hypothetical protein